MLREALQYPLRDGAEERLLAGWILHLVHALLLPGVPLVYVLGYLMAVLRASSTGETPPDPWDWRTIIRDAARGIVVIVAYGAIPALVFVFGYLLLPRGAGDFSLFLVSAITAMTVFLAIPPLFLLPIGLTRTATTGSISAAFDKPAVFSRGRTVSYLVWWSVGVVVFSLGLWLIGVLGTYLVGYLGAFYCEVVACYAFGRGTQTR